jgi:hypothetical protein
MYPVHLVVEMGGRVWALFNGRYSSLLGTLIPPGYFIMLNDPSTEFVYLVVSQDILRMEA